MQVDTWDPTQYERFLGEREQPFLDLFALVEPSPAMRIVDLGCGTGRLTRMLHDRLQARETVGVDRSERMLQSAGENALPGALRFERGSIEAFAGEREYDLIFSNAALHWVVDHEALVARLYRALKPGGQLAFQIPAMHRHPSHIVADELVTSEPFRGAVGGWRRPQPVLEPEAYAELLFRAGFPEPKVRLIVYPHVLARRDEVVEWVRGSLLTEYEKHFDGALFTRFLDAYRERLLDRLSTDEPFLFPFRRIVCWGRKSA